MRAQARRPAARAETQSRGQRSRAAADERGRGSCLLYELTVQGCIGMPVGLIEARLREDLKVNLLAVEQAAIQHEQSIEND